MVLGLLRSVGALGALASAATSGAVIEQATEQLRVEVWGPVHAIAAQLSLPAGGPLLFPNAALRA